MQQPDNGQSMSPNDRPLNHDNATTLSARFAAGDESTNLTSLPTSDNLYATTATDARVKMEEATDGANQQGIAHSNEEHEHNATLLAAREISQSLDLKSHHAMRMAESAEPIASPTPTPSILKPTVPKKRPAPKGTAKKKGTKKPPPKKRKLQAEDRKPSQSVTPAGSSPAPSDDQAASEASDDEDDAVYCICRRPDDHKWMIGCDGDCEDWFHGKCIHIRQEDGDLIDKFLCPNCTAKGIGITTWKPMCRREGCRRPARLKKGAASKYCSDDCGVRFFKELAARHTPSATHTRKTTKAQPPSPAKYDLGPLGGPIRPSEIKALAYSADDADQFRLLGHAGILTPPPSTSPGDESTAVSNTTVTIDSTALSQADTHRLSEIATRKDALRARRTLLKARQRFVVWARERAARRNAEMKVKNLCAFDTRLSWSDAEFERWWRSPEGIDAFERETLDPPEPAKNTETEDAQDDEAGQARGNEGIEETVCMERRCTRHQAWQKLVLEDIRFEEADVGDEMRRVDGEETDIRARAAIAAKVAAAAVSAAALDESGGDWVEVVGEDEAVPPVEHGTRGVSTPIGTPVVDEGTEQRVHVDVQVDRQDVVMAES